MTDARGTDLHVTTPARRCAATGSSTPTTRRQARRPARRRGHAAVLHGEASATPPRCTASATSPRRRWRRRAAGSPRSSAPSRARSSSPSGATEANNLALIGYAMRNRRKGDHVIITEAEHISVLNIAKYLEKNGFRVTRAPIDLYGRVSPKKLRARITDETILV